MDIATTTYDRLIASKGAGKIFWHIVRKLLVRVMGDPPCTFMIHGRPMQLPLSHALPRYLAKYPLYDSLPRRIAAFVREHRGYISCMDVGANIGDTVAGFGGGDGCDGRYLAVEPNPKFSKYLAANWGSDEKVTALRVLCASASTAGRRYKICESNGTASIVEEVGGAGIETASVDDIVLSGSGFGYLNILKIDTDGHDFEVLSGAKETIRTLRPVVLFECDAFSNAKYVDDCLAALSFFKSAGYRSFLVYDNFGYLMGSHSLDDLGHFKDLLFYQMTSPFYYFDILLMPGTETDLFLETEREFFVEHMAQRDLEQTARVAAA